MSRRTSSRSWRQSGGPRRPRHRARRIRLAFLVALAIAGVALMASHSQAASAAVAHGPRIEMILARQHVTAGHRAGLTYLASDVPSGARVYLELRPAGSGQPWIVARRLHHAGTIAAPALRAGAYQLRAVISRSGHVLASSARSRLTVSAPRSPGLSPDVWSWIGKFSLMVLGYLLG